MEINYYRIPTTAGTDESWQNCQFTSETDLSALTVNPLVTINGQPILRQHHVTYLTGKETCHAHHFAKHLAIQLLSAPSDKPDGSCKVLWIDTLHGPHVCASIYRELAAHATSSSKSPSAIVSSTTSNAPMTSSPKPSLSTSSTPSR